MGDNSYGNTSKRRCYSIPIRLKEEGKKDVWSFVLWTLRAGQEPPGGSTESQQRLGEVVGLGVLQTPLHCYQALSCKSLFSIQVQPQLEVPA